MHARLERWALTYDDVAAGALLKTSLDLWATRDRIRNDLDARIGSWRTERRERWAAVRCALMGESAPIPPSSLFGRPADEVMPALASAFSEQRQWSDVVLASREAHHRETQRRLHAELGPRRTFVRYVAALRSRLGLIRLMPSTSSTSAPNGSAGSGEAAERRRAATSC